MFRLLNVVYSLCNCNTHWLHIAIFQSKNAIETSNIGESMDLEGHLICVCAIELLLIDSVRYLTQLNSDWNWIGYIFLLNLYFLWKWNNGTDTCLRLLSQHSFCIWTTTTVKVQFHNRIKRVVCFNYQPSPLFRIFNVTLFKDFTYPFF